MVIEEALTTKLLTVLAELVGDRVYPDALPEHESDDTEADTEGGTDDGDDTTLPPSVVYQRAGDETGTSLNGGGRSNIRVETYTVELWSSLRSDGWKFRELMLAAFAGRNAVGRWGGAGGVWVCGAVASDSQAESQDSRAGDDNPDRVERLSLRIVYDTSK